MTKLLTKPIFFALLAALAGALAWGGIATVKVADLRTEIADVKTKHSQELADQAKADKEQIEALTAKNQEIQRDYLQTQKEFAAYRAGVARGDGVRNAERQDIIDAAGRVSRACGRYADAAERDIGAVEADAGRLGQEAHRASSAYSATRKTLDERRAALEARRKALKPQEN
jgi:hypothetical protein